MYQVPNFDEESAFILVEWLLDEYKYEPIEVVIDCLTHPPHTGEKNWRLTPDTIRGWMAIALEKEAERKEREHDKAKSEYRETQGGEISEETQRLINAFLKRLAPEQSARLIEKKQYQPLPAEEVKRRELHLQWIREHLDPYTGKLKPNGIEEKEWLKLKGL